ncbi:GNAT family N-acetyltransferase [Nocardia sp. NPDC048505]|uniref:GNAT family N-acetyltransferase n=1 Tax=unclassified Nocardia TaxID=2637762 RepID=UPI003401C498
MISSRPDIEFRTHTSAEARELRSTVEEIFRHSYVQAIESGDTFETPEAFMRRFDAYTHPERARGFELVMAWVDGVACGQTWGWPLFENTRWWGGLELDQGELASFTAEDGKRTFALSEIMVRVEFAGKGIARAMHDELLGNRAERRATLLVDPLNTRAYQTYVHWGWSRVGVLRPAWPEAPLFDVLIRELPST